MISMSESGEEAFFFGEGEDYLFGFMHRSKTAARAAIVMCHALAEEKLWSQRVYVGFARELALAGYDVLRFDMRGEGDSGLEFEESTVETRVEDTVSAIREARRRSSASSVLLLGHRFGGTIAAQVASRVGSEVAGLIVWDPILDGEEYFGQLLRSNLTGQMAIHGKVVRTRADLIDQITGGTPVIVDGYGLTNELYRGMAQSSWMQLSGGLNCPALVVVASSLEGAELPDMLRESVQDKPDLRVLQVKEPPFWRETRQFHRSAEEFGRVTHEWLGGQEFS